MENLLLICMTGILILTLVAVGSVVKRAIGEPPEEPKPW